MPTIGSGRIAAGTGSVTFRPGDEAASEQDGMLPSGSREPTVSVDERSVYVRSVSGNDLGNGAVLFRGTNGELDVILDFKSIVAGDGIHFDDSANELRISATGGGTGGLPDSGVVPGSYDYASIVVDTQGRIRFARANVAGDVSNAQNLGFGSPLYVNKQVGVLRFRSLRGDVSSGVTTSVVGDEIVIGVSGVVRNLTAIPQTGITVTGSPVSGSGTLGIGLADSGVTAGTYSSANIVVDRFGRVTTAASGSVAPSNIVVSQNNTVVGTFARLDLVGAAVTEPVMGTARISIPAPAVANLSNRTGSGAAVFAALNAGTGEFRRIVGSGVASVTESANEITINVPAPPSASLTGVANLSAGGGQVFDSIVGGIAGLRRIVGSGGVTVTTSGSDIVVDSSALLSTIPTTGVVPGTYTVSRIVVGADGRITNATSGQAVTSVALSTGAGLTSGGGPITGAGTLAVGLATSGVTAGTYTMSSVVVDQFGRITSAVSGDLAPSGVSPGTYAFSTVVVDSRGRVTLAQAGSPVTNVGIAAATGISVAGGPVTSTGTFTVGLSNSGVAAGTYTLTSMVVDQFGRITSAASGTVSGGAGGTVTSVALGGSEFQFAGSPVTTAGTISIALAPTGVAAGTYTSVVVDSKGRITAGGQATTPTFVSSVAMVGSSGITVGGGPVISAGTFTVGLSPSGVSAGTYARSNIVVDQFGRITSASSGSESPLSFAGDVVGSGSAGSTVALTLVNSGVTAGTYRVATVVLDSKGRVTSAEAGAAVTSVALAAGSGVTIAGGPITAEGTLTVGLGTSGVIAGSYALSNIVVDQFGRITSASSGSASGNGITALTLSGTEFTFAGSPLTTAGTIGMGLAPTGVAAGTYNQVVVDDKGRVLSGANVSAGPVWQRASVVTANYTLLAADTYVGVGYSATGPCTITLPSGQGFEGRRVIVKDEGGNAFANNITLSSVDLIDGATTVLLDTNFHSLSLVYSNGSWWLI